MASHWRINRNLKIIIGLYGALNLQKCLEYRITVHSKRKSEMQLKDKKKYKINKNFYYSDTPSFI